MGQVVLFVVLAAMAYLAFGEDTKVDSSFCAALCWLFWVVSNCVIYRVSSNPGTPKHCVLFTSPCPLPSAASLAAGLIAVFHTGDCASKRQGAFRHICMECKQPLSSHLPYFFIDLYHLTLNLVVNLALSY